VIGPAGKLSTRRSVDAGRNGQLRGLAYLRGIAALATAVVVLLLGIPGYT
jgi:hypothetical protein